MPPKSDKREQLTEWEKGHRRRPVMSPAVVRLLCSPPNPLDIPFYTLQSELSAAPLPLELAIP